MCLKRNAFLGPLWRIAASVLTAVVLGLGGAPAFADDADRGPRFETPAPPEAAPETAPLGTSPLDRLLDRVEGARPRKGEPEASNSPLRPPARTDRRYIDAAEFRDAFENRTVHLNSGGIHYGSEYYLPGDRSIWIGSGGPCKKGEWRYSGDLFCFTYGPDGPHCWRVFEVDGVYYAESIEGLVLRIYSVEERPLNCDPGLFS